MSTLRFLLLENNPSDAEAIQAKLLDCDMDYELLRVNTHADFVAALESQTVDLILAEHPMPDDDGIAALEIASALRSEIPVIVVADSLDEERAIATLNQGATDYILKPRLGRLVPCVQRALQETVERRQQQIALRESEAKYYTLFESIDQGFCLCEMLFDENGKPIDYRFLSVNPIFGRLTGLEYATGKTIRELVPNLETDWFEMYGRVVQTGESVRFENQSIVMNRWFDVNAFRIGEPQSNQFAILFTNITERKQLEQERDRFLAVGSDLQVITGSKGYFQWVSPTFERFLGWTLDEMVSRPWTDFVHPDDIPESTLETDSLFSGNQTIAFENRYRHKDGSYRWLLWNAQPYPSEQVIYGTAIDITDRKQAELNANFLAVVSQELVKPTSVDKIIQAIGEQLHRFLDITICAFVEINEQVDEAIINYDWHQERAPSLIGLYDLTEFVTDEFLQVAKAGQPIVIRNFATDPRISDPDRYAALGIGAEINIPLIREGKWKFSLTVFHLQPYNWRNDEIELMQELANRIWAKLERARAEAALQESEEQSRNILESIDDAFFALDQNWQFTYVNQTAEILLHRAPGDLIGKTFWEEFPGVNGSEFEQLHRRVMRDRVAGSLTSFYPDHDRWYEVRSYPAVNGITIYFRNVSERIQAEAELRESEARFRTLADNMSQFAWMADPNGWIFWYNHRWFEYTGTTLEEMQGWGWQQVHHPDHVDRVVEHFRHCIETGAQWEDTFPLRGTDGAYRWFLSRAIPIKDEAGTIVRWFGTNTDITSRKQIEAELRQKNAILDVVNESAPTPIFVKDRQGRIIYANPATLNVLGKSAAEVIGYYDIDLYPSPEEAAKVMENDRRIMETGQTEVVEESPDGIRTFLGMKSPFRNEAGEVIGLVGIANDISDRKRIEAEREQLLQQEQVAREAAEQANRMKDEFLAVVSHELRTPLNPILGWSKLLKSGKLPPEKVATALETIERNAQQQAQLIDDLLDISRILQNKLTLAIVPVDLTVVITNALETVRLSAEAKGIELKFESAELKLVDSSDLQSTIHNPQFQILGDASRLQQIVWNLLSNAIKFTPENGQVEVRLERGQGSGVRGQGSGNDSETRNLKPETYNPISETWNPKPETSPAYAQITISDTGKGILLEFLPHLFEAFRQEDNTITRKFGGLGLGLSIVQQLVALHGGTVTATSDGEGQGATFTVRLPIAPRQSNSPTRSSNRQSIDLSGIQILVVDDIIDSQELVAFVLRQAGAIVTTADSAQAAVNLLAQMKPDIIISDIGMPDRNGYELLQQIRSDFIQLQTVPAIALSAYASEQDRQQALAAGFQRHMAKPIDSEALVKTVAMLTQAPK